MKILITGGAGFIGANLIHNILGETNHSVVNVDVLNYAGNIESLSDIEDSSSYVFEHIDICNKAALTDVFAKHRPDVVMHLAAESHVDRSIDGPSQFIQTNIIGTYNLLEVSLEYWRSLSIEKQQDFRFHHISTDEVFGDLGTEGGLFNENTQYDPSSPYSASKASSDHLVRAWFRTYGMPIIISNCSNNYGPYQFPEKLIPLMVLNALEEKELPLYGDGLQIRDWLFVEDHVKALYLVLTKGTPGESYNIGGHNEKTNVEVVHCICELLEELVTDKVAEDYLNKFKVRIKRNKYADLITYVEDRPGHDLRYAVDASKILHELGWVPAETFKSGLRKTIQWYLDNLNWCLNVRNGTYKRLGLALK